MLTISVLFTYGTFVGGKNLYFYPSVPIFDLVHNEHAAHLPVSVQMNGCLYETAFFPSN